MKISIKITGLEITIDTDDATNGALAIADGITQALQSAVQPMLVATPAQPKRKARAAVEAQGEPEHLPKESPLASTAAPAPTDTAVYLNGHVLTEPPKKRLPFEEFDRQVRAEMKRLAPSPGMMPGHTLWNDQRAPYLPTMGGVISRYDCISLVELAKALGLNPPLGKPGPVAKAAANGAPA